MRKIKKKNIENSILDRFQRDETFNESQLAHGWTETFDISHQVSPEQRARYKDLYHLRYDPESLESGPMKDRPDYYKVTRAVISMNKEAGQNPRPMPHSNKCLDDLDLEKRQCLTWLSHNGNTYFEKKRHTDEWFEIQ